MSKHGTSVDIFDRAAMQVKKPGIRCLRTEENPGICYLRIEDCHIAGAQREAKRLSRLVYALVKQCFS